jgi:hypothetical protein
MGMQIIGITNNLNFALNANRLKMMTKKKTPMIKVYKFAWSILVVAFLLVTCAKPSNNLESKTENETEDLKSSIEKNTTRLLHSGKVIDFETGNGIPGVMVSVKDKLGRIAGGALTDKNGNFVVEERNPVLDDKTGSINTDVEVRASGYITVNKIFISDKDGKTKKSHLIKLKKKV